ncbi:hypothetical protein EYR41_010057 [Orbilia oligospora]|uniref:Uncharacterized protein n=1 Tax=Orbilia oligospora TaxID=2813651 RepID=A0A7C8KEB6_ORBOL|nr:hypothetical protein TWF751_005395 [Orbilia oligospora]TGJ63973.1 hypothetical protein EYR41_010057 [Orbilia oligospora]
MPPNCNGKVLDRESLDKIFHPHSAEQQCIFAEGSRYKRIELQILTSGAALFLQIYAKLSSDNGKHLAEHQREIRDYSGKDYGEKCVQLSNSLGRNCQFAHPTSPLFPEKSAAIELRHSFHDLDILFSSDPRSIAGSATSW